MTNSLVFLTVLLLSGLALAGSRNPWEPRNPFIIHQPWTEPECADVAWYFLSCMNFLKGIEPNPASDCCGQLGKLNEIAPHTDGPDRICKCVVELDQAIGAILEPHDESLSGRCGVYRGFPLRSGCPED